MKKIHIVYIGVAALFLSLLALFLHIQAQSTIKAISTPLPYKPPLRNQEIPQSTHRAQSSLAISIATNFNPWGIAVDALNGFICMAEPGCDAAPTCLQSAPTVLGKFSQADGGLLQEYQQSPDYSNPLFLAVASDGKVWFTDSLASVVDYFNSATGAVTKKILADPNAHPHDDLLIDQENTVWLTLEFGRSLNT